MNIITTQLKAYQFTIPHDEALAAIADPSLIVNKLKAAVNGAFDDGTTATTEVALRKPGKRTKLGNRPKYTGAAYAKVECPVTGCGKKLASARLALHLRTKHPGVETTTR